MKSESEVWKTNHGVGKFRPLYLPLWN